MRSVYKVDTNTIEKYDFTTNFLIDARHISIQTYKFLYCQRKNLYNAYRKGYKRERVKTIEKKFMIFAHKRYAEIRYTRTRVT